MKVEPRILLVEDDEADVILFKRCCRKQGLEVRVDTARDGTEALDYLRGPDRPAGRIVIVTDLNMPRLTGHEFIETLRSDPGLAGHVIFVLSTSSLPEDIGACYRQCVAGYIVKDAHGRRLMDCVGMFAQYFQAVTLN